LKILKGNPGQRALNTREPRPRDGEPRCPSKLNAAARAEWHNIIVELRAMRLLASADHAVLEAYCATYARFIEAHQDLQEHGTTFETATGYLVPRPSVALEQKSIALLRVLAADLGLSPSARSRLTLPETKEVDPLEALLN
jgi:P27 family predicted phage terminase small subunit